MNALSSTSPPPETIRVLIVEDNEEHANLFGLFLERAKTHNFLVTKTGELATAIEFHTKQVFDVILLDLTLQESQGIDTFYRLKTHSKNTPIVILTGTDNEMIAVEAVRGGAQDYLIKGQADQQLIVRSIRYALERKKSEDSLRLSEERFRLLIENSNDLIGLIDRDLQYTYASPSYQKIVGYSPAEMIGKNLGEILHADEVEIITDKIDQAFIFQNFQINLDFQLRDAGGNWKFFSGCISHFSNSTNIPLVAINCHEITDRIQKEKELVMAYEATLVGWSRALELRSKEVEGHSQRVTEMTLKLAKAAGMSQEELVHVRRGALLHDIGKMAIPDNILTKSGDLSPVEWEVMKLHTSYAWDMLYPIDYLRPALDIPAYHHEKWDGSGYPNQLKGKEIPLAARVFMIIDVWDALISERSYREAWSQEKAKEYIKDLSGKHFDPEIVEIFLEIY